MIVAEQKSLEELKNLVGNAENVLVVGCGTCVTVCFAGGAREASVVASSLRMASKLEGAPKAVNDVTVQRQCEWEYLDEIVEQQVETVLKGVTSAQKEIKRFIKDIAINGHHESAAFQRSSGVMFKRCLNSKEAKQGIADWIEKQRAPWEE